MNPLLNVSNLNVTYTDTAISRRIIEDVSFSVNTATVLAIVGESGSGKTTLCRALTRLFSQSSRLKVRGVVQFNSSDLLHCTDEMLRHIRQTQIRYIFQEPQQALNPVLTIRRQMEFASGKQSIAQDELIPILNSVGLGDAVGVSNSYPHQLSIGMAQRVMIAMTLMPKPSLLIADEPTSAVDASLRYRVLDLLKSFQQQDRMAMILVTHDLCVARRYADHVAVIQNGRIIEYATTNEFFEKPQHPYSQKLLDAIPSLSKRVIRANNGTAGE